MRKLTTENNRIVPYLSLIVPGSGQYFQKKQFRGVVIFITTLLTLLLVIWANQNYKIGQINMLGIKTTWMWIPLLGFWIWNVFDSVNLFAIIRVSPLPGAICIAIILYVTAWIVTDVKLDRLVTRIDAAGKVFENIINPDFFSVTVNNEPVICSWDCLSENLQAKLQGKPAQKITISANVLDIFGQVKERPARGILVKLGFLEQGEMARTYVTGKLIETIALGIMATLFSTIVAVPVSFLGAKNVMSRVPGGMVIYGATRTFLNIFRAVDTVVWGLLVIVWVGLGTFAGVIALTIHSTAALGKLFSEEIEHIDSGPVEAVTAVGGNFFQVIRFAIIPQIIPSFLGYTLLRWDINMRSATVVGFVAGGGIGFFVLETIRQGAYQQYAAALWAVVVVIILVDYLSEFWRSRILEDQPRETKSQNRMTRVKTGIAIFVGVIVFIYCWAVTEINLAELFNPGPTFGRLLRDFVSIDVTPKILDGVTRQMVITILQAFLATTLGAILATPASFFAAKNLTGKSKFSIWIYYLTRSVFNILRSIEALLYAAIFVFWVGIGPFAGMLALAVTTFALIGKLFSEAIENIETGPIEAINATGANRLQMIFYGILPQIFPPFVSYLVYQWDINIRMATIIGFAGGGGIGLTLSTFFGSLQYHKAGTVILFIVVVVAAMDFASARIRERLV